MLLHTLNPFLCLLIFIPASLIAHWELHVYVPVLLSTALAMLATL